MALLLGKSPAAAQQVGAQQLLNIHFSRSQAHKFTKYVECQHVRLRAVQGARCECHVAATCACVHDGALHQWLHVLW
jgi:hypothetical protein